MADTDTGQAGPSAAQKFFVGDIVEKISGDTKFWGEVKCAYEIRPGAWRYDVMAIHPEFYGLVHIYSSKDLQIRWMPVVTDEYGT